MSLCVASQRVFIVVYFVIDSVRKLLDTPSSSGTSGQMGYFRCLILTPGVPYDRSGVEILTLQY
jgi:hypothetical protein